jgi:hypothetical protein
MKFTLKNHKLAKIKTLIKTQKILFFCHFINDTTNKCIKLEQKMLKKKVKLFKTDSSLVYFLFKNSIYLNVTNLIFGPVAILYFNLLHFFNKIFNLTNKLYIFFFIFNKKFYPLKLILYLKTLKYVVNINILFNFFKKVSYNKFLSTLFIINKRFISK